MLGELIVLGALGLILAGAAAKAQPEKVREQAGRRDKPKQERG